jgi:hypothetical protein
VTVRRGEDWGEPGALSVGAPVFGDDRDAALFVRDRLLDRRSLDGGLAGGDEPIEIGLVGGDLHASLGSPRHGEEDLRGASGTRFPVDVGLVRAQRVGGGEISDCFLAHLVAREGRRVGTVFSAHGLFSSRTVVIMNATHRGDQDLGPRAHPNDGLLDVTDGQLLPGERIRARRRMRTGTHLPHPMLATSRGRSVEFRFSRPSAVELDGEPIGTITELGVRCLPDAIVVVV